MILPESTGVQVPQCCDFIYGWNSQFFINVFRMFSPCMCIGWVTLEIFRQDTRKNSKVTDKRFIFLSHFSINEIEILRNDVNEKMKNMASRFLVDQLEESLNHQRDDLDLALAECKRIGDVFTALERSYDTRLIDETKTVSSNCSSHVT